MQEMSFDELEKQLRDFCPPEGSIMVCIQCEKKEGLLVCSRCHDYNYGRYCSQECQKKDWMSHKRICYPMDKTLFDDKGNTVLHLAMRRNLFSEYQGFSWNTGRYDTARHLIYKGVIAIIMADPVNGASSIAGREDIMAGCRILKEIEPSVMSDKTDLLWLFIPQPLFSHIESLYLTV